MQNILVIDYGSGNLLSVRRALEAADPNICVRVGAAPDMIAGADRIVLPGVGHFVACMGRLRAADGLLEALQMAVLRKGTPFFGICVGMQVLVGCGVEDGRTPGLGWIDGETALLPSSCGLPVPHMGWNAISIGDHAMFDGLEQGAHMYFAHSYVVRPEQDENVAAQCEYGEKFVAAIGRDNIFATQFHPEKSQRDGLRLFGNFLRWRP